MTIKSLKLRLTNLYSKDTCKILIVHDKIKIVILKIPIFFFLKTIQ